MRHIGVQVFVIVASAACSSVTEVRIGGDERAAQAVPDIQDIDDGRDAQLAEAPRTVRNDTALPPTSEDASTASPVCPADRADCDGDAANGCEANLMRDPQHCGDCSTACQSADCACQDGVVVTLCPAGRADCDGDALTGCETDILTDMRHCGACQRRCHADGFAVASATCDQGECRITCERPTLRGDCDESPDNGCEAELWEDPENCGGCGRDCQICSGGRCL